MLSDKRNDPSIVHLHLLSPPISTPLTSINQKVYNMRHQMTARTDNSDLDRYFPAYATGRELGMNVARQISRRFGRTTGARTRPAADYSITATLSVVPDPLDPWNPAMDMFLRRC